MWVSLGSLVLEVGSDSLSPGRWLVLGVSGVVDECLLGEVCAGEVVG